MEGKMHAVSTRICMLLLASVPLSADAWTIVAPLPDATWRPSAAASGGDGLVYAIGGLNGSGPPSTSQVFVYDPGSNAWSAAPPLAAGPRRNLAAATDYQGRIYAIAGYTPEFPLATVERFDPALGYWTRLPDLPDARQGLAAATGGDGRIYAIGGAPFNFQPTARVDAFDSDGWLWVQVASMGTPRSGFGAAVGPDGRIYAIGGYDGFGNVASVEVYDPNTDTWAYVAPMNYAHANRAAATGADGKIYVLGGEVAYPPLGVVEAYTADILAAPGGDLAREGTRSRQGQERTRRTTSHTPPR
jgi:N-acetylneuraminic acid mutarotase